MSLFRYKVLLADGGEKESKITAKTKEEAQARVAQLNKVTEWIWIKEEKASSGKPPTKSPARVKTVPAAPIAAKQPPITSTPTAPKSGTKLDRLLFQQSNKCFFCGRHLDRTEASIEHLQPKADGGNNADGNVVACCGALNRTFGDISLKRKMEIILKKAGNFKCPSS